MALGGLSMPGLRGSWCWRRWMLVMVGSRFRRLALKVDMASLRVLGGSVSKKRKRLSGRLET